MSSPSWSMPSASRATTIFTPASSARSSNRKVTPFKDGSRRIDGLRPEQQAGVVTAIADRPDALQLQTFAQSEIEPFLWKIIVETEGIENHALRQMAEDLLRRMNPGVKLDFQKPEARLVAFAEPSTTTPPDSPPPRPTPTARLRPFRSGSGIEGGEAHQAGRRADRQRRGILRTPLRAAALEKKPDYEPAQGIVLTLAAERAMERAHFGNLAIAEPATFRLLSDAPSTTLNDLLNFGINRKKTALVLAMLQVLGDRADRDAATPPAGPPRPSLLVKALGYPDPQVQFAAADALLRSPVPVPPEVRGQIVEILRRAAAVDAGAPANAKGTALLADPNKRRSDAVALLLRGMGYDVEVFRTGRDLHAGSPVPPTST